MQPRFYPLVSVTEVTGERAQMKQSEGLVQHRNFTGACGRCGISGVEKVRFVAGVPMSDCW